MLAQALCKVFRKPTYVFLALFAGASTFMVAAWFPNFRLIASVVGASDVSLSSKIGLPISLLGSIVTNFTLFSASYTLIIAVLFGAYIAMTTYFLRRRIKEIGQEGIATGFLGITSGVFGVGCAACGSFLLTSLTLVGAGGVLAFLPLGGSEFGLVGAVLLGGAIYMTAKKIVDPLVCKISN